MPAHLTTELALLGWSVVLFFVHMTIQASANLRETGLGYNAGPRDGGEATGRSPAAPSACSTISRRATWSSSPLRSALVASGRAGGLADTGAWLWFGARVVYIPLYLASVPRLRTLCWGVGAVGLVLMLVRLL